MRKARCQLQRFGCARPERGDHQQVLPAFSDLFSQHARFLPRSGWHDKILESRGFYANDISQVPSFNTSMTWVKSNHTVKFGGEVRIEGYPAQVQANASGSYGFSRRTRPDPHATGAS